VARAVCIVVGFLQLASKLLIRQLTPELKSSVKATPANINSEQKKRLGSPIYIALLVFVLQRFGRNQN
jgi:hypothetical protein